LSLQNYNEAHMYVPLTASTVFGQTAYAFHPCRKIKSNT